MNALKKFIHERLNLSIDSNTRVQSSKFYSLIYTSIFILTAKFAVIFLTQLFKKLTQKLIDFKGCLFGYDKNHPDGYNLKEIKCLHGFFENRNEFFGDQNMLKNECGFKLKNVTVQDSGKWYCEFVKWNKSFIILIFFLYK